MPRCCLASPLLDSASSSSSTSSLDDLRKPLLDLSRASSNDEDNNFDSSKTSGGLDEDDDDALPSSSSSLESWCDSFLAWFVLPCLLWLDFWLVLHNTSSSGGSSYGSAVPLPSVDPVPQAQVVSMASVHLSFIMFIVASFLYRKTLEEHECESVVLLLVPEIAMNVMLLLIFGNKTFAAYMVLLGVILALSAVVVAFSAFRLGCVHEVRVVGQAPVDENDEEDNDDLEGGRVVKPSSIRR